MRVFDRRPTLSRQQARSVYDRFAITNHAGGKDADSGYGGPAIRALLAMATHLLSTQKTTTTISILDYGCGQGKLAELMFSNHDNLIYRGVDQSPKMVEKAKERLSNNNNKNKFPNNVFQIDLLEDGEPTTVLDTTKPKSIDLFISTYCLDLLSEKDMYAVLDVAETSLEPNNGVLLLAGITWGYRSTSSTIQTFLMTLVWEFLYVFFRKKVGGCRPQNLEPYLKERGWDIVDSVRTLPAGFPWMVSEVISARPPRKKAEKAD